jgi:hypothetical protein
MPKTFASSERACYFRAQILFVVETAKCEDGLRLADNLGCAVSRLWKGGRFNFKITISMN